MSIHSTIERDVTYAAANFLAERRDVLQTPSRIFGRKELYNRGEINHTEACLRYRQSPSIL